MTGEFQIAIIGAGPAGLSAALTLSRALRPVIVFDSPRAPRNAASPGFGGLLGRERATAADLHAIGREEIERYGFARFHGADAARIEQVPGGGFSILGADGTRATAAVVLLACGMVDRFPEIRRLDDFWNRSAVYCPFCDGFELRDGPRGVFVNRPEMLDAAEIYLTWTDDLILFLDTGIAVPTEREAALAAKGGRVERHAIRGLRVDAPDQQAVEMADGSAIERQALVLWPSQAQTELVREMGLPLDDAAQVAVDETATGPGCRASTRPGTCSMPAVRTATPPSIWTPWPLPRSWRTWR